MWDSDRRFVFYAHGKRHPDLHSRLYVPVIPTAGQAKAWLDHFIGTADVEQCGNTLLLRSDFDISLRCDQLDELRRTAASSLPPDQARLILRFKYGTWDEVHAREPEPIDDDTPALPRAPRPERERRPDIPPGYVSITDLCAGSSLLPTHARAALRGSGRIKPAYGWAFSPAELPAIRKLIGLTS